MKGYDILGNVAIVKFDKKDSAIKKKREAKILLNKQKSVKTVLEKTQKFKGRFRKQNTKFIVGEKTKEVLYKENGCVFRFNADTCYFSPRLASERLEIAKKVRRGEKVLVMFGGAAPFAIVMAKKSKVGKVVSVEISRACNKYALENVKRNKVNDRVEILQGDVRKVLPKMKVKFERIVMARPNLEDNFLDAALSRIKKDGIIHYYGFCSVDEIEAMKFMILQEAKIAKKKIKILNVKKAGDIGAYVFRWRIDLKVL